ncbi:YncE family protein [uncultured Streptomyces sp.]|uniref:YncE family protein n=1 Tax=uncultured Streptomyces sp. TaxID=174707 RepID=UPI002610C6DF|nr:YncE family protein [uncultured Streptomyces sp.]
MSSATTRIRSIATVVVMGTSLALTGTVTAQASSHSATATATAETFTLGKGLYQTAYSERNHVLWATTAVGRPPVTSSSLLKVDPRTLAVKQTITPPTTNATTGAVEAVYGVAVDDEHNTVWTTNTRDNSVAVYDQRTGAHLATLPGVAHAREIVVDERHNTVWASAFGEGSVVAFDSRTLKEKERLTVEGSAPTGLALNEKTGDLYAADLNNDRVIEFGHKDDEPRFLPAGDGPISVSLSKNGKTAYTANQTSGDLSVIDLKKGAVAATVATGAGALAVATDEKSGRVLVANRTAANVTIVDPKKAAVVQTLATAANPNHIEIANGSAYVVDKSGAGADGQDQVTRIRLAR